MAIKINLPILGQPNPDEPTDVHLVGRYAVGVLCLLLLILLIPPVPIAIQ